MRGAHQAFFLDDDEKTRAVELLRRVEEFSGVIVLAYAIMSNHFDIFRQTVRTLVLTIHHRTLPVYTFTHLHIKGRGASPVEYPPAGVWKGQT